MDGTHIMFATFNDTNVGKMTFPWFASNTVIAATGVTSRGSFPASKAVRYPTPGTLNPEVQLWILDISNLTEPIKWLVKPPLALEEQ
jgi:inactive dipeptidyl peptidase 10